MCAGVVATATVLGVCTPATAAPATNPPAADQTTALAGANDWSCKPTAAHPRPVVLVHGTWADMTTTWSTLSPQLAERGYCVFALNYGTFDGVLNGNLLDLAGGADIASSARQLADFVNRVLRSTGAKQVDLVGHSQGGVVARQYLRFNGGTDHFDPRRNRVHTLVTLGATNHGSTFGLFSLLNDVAHKVGLPLSGAVSAAAGPAYIEQLVGSPFLAALNAGGDTERGVDYTVIATRDDKISTPPERTFLAAGPGATVHNVWVQDGCPGDTADHGQLTTDARSLYLVQSALDPAYGRTHPAPCG
ncbi:alpha/beta fold hydrolase [Rhodococcus sp. D2-41]|uniref:esterase/lipase family protein n=1 Tax=Speluncibacter jeojiensis TaxID=2710754 RepID=UPI00385307BE|nr:alpha/beta fold hydrolase [Rhodococcus sp. D2-41]